MERNTSKLDRVIQLSDTLRSYWEDDNVTAVFEVVRTENRKTLELVIYTLLSDLEALASR